MIHLDVETVTQVFQFQQFWLVDHKFDREILIEELFQIVQIITIIWVKSQTKTKSTIKIKSRITRATFVELSKYSSEWAINKIVFRKTCSDFWIAIEKYRTSRKFCVFKSRYIQIESVLNDDSNQLSSSSQFSFLLETLFKIFFAFKKKFLRRSISLQSISLNYAKIVEIEQRNVKYSEITQDQETITSSDESFVTAKASSFKEKVREVHEKTTDEKISRMNRIIKTNLQKMLNVIVIAKIAAAVATISQTTLSSSTVATSFIAFSENYRQQERWNLVEIEFFDSNFDEKFAFTNEALIHADKNTYYRNVHVFVERIKKMIIVLEFEMIRKNLFFYLRDSVLMWHIVEFFDVSRRILFYEENVDEWVQALIARFKTQATTTTANLLKKRYTLTNAERNRESREYAQKVIRWVKFAKMFSSFNQLNIVYNEINAELRRDLKKSSKNTTINDYLQLLNDYKDI